MKEIKQILLEMKEKVLSEINDVRKKEQEEHDEIGDDYDKASMERERELGIILSAQEKNRLVAIEDALRRISEGSYGICEECGCKISKARLKALPFATTCVECKSKKEQEEGTFRPFEDEDEEPFQENIDEQIEEDES